MKLDRLETHDRLLHFKKDQALNIFQGAEDCLKRNPDSILIQDKCPYVYIFAHPRTSEDGVTKRMLWQPRIGRPKPDTNSYCFRAKSHTDILEVCWLIPPRETWAQYKKGNVTENELVLWSIDQFTNHFEKLDAPHPDDLPEEKQKDIFRSMCIDIQFEKQMGKILC